MTMPRSRYKLSSTSIHSNRSPLQREQSSENKVPISFEAVVRTRSSQRFGRRQSAPHRGRVERHRRRISGTRRCFSNTPMRSRTSKVDEATSFCSRKIRRPLPSSQNIAAPSSGDETSLRRGNLQAAPSSFGRARKLRCVRFRNTFRKYFMRGSQN